MLPLIPLLSDPDTLSLAIGIDFVYCFCGCHILPPIDFQLLFADCWVLNNPLAHLIVMCPHSTTSSSAADSNGQIGRASLGGSREDNPIHLRRRMCLEETRVHEPSRLVAAFGPARTRRTASVENRPGTFPTISISWGAIGWAKEGQRRRQTRRWSNIAI